MLPASYLAQLRALVVDDQSSMRGALRDALAEAQIRDVHTAASAEAAVAMVRSMRFGLVLTDFNLGDGTNGQQLLEYLRGKALLPADALFFLVTGEATQDRVVCAGEIEPDGFIVKPVTKAVLLDRVEEGLQRQSELKHLHASVAAGDWRGTVAMCDRLDDAGCRYTLRLHRLKAQALGELGRWDEALSLYRGVQALRDVHWAAYGIARCLAEMGDGRAARTQLETLLATRPYHSPANDLLITLLERENDLAGAVDAAAAAAQAIPSASRGRRLARLALRDGRLDLAERSAARLVRSTARSITRDVADSGLLADVHLARGDARAALEAVARLKDDDDPRAAGLRAAVTWQASMALGDEAAAAEAREALAHALDDAHDGRSGLQVARAALAASLREPALALLARVTPEGAAGDSARAQAREVLREAGIVDEAGTFGRDTVDDAVREIDEAVAWLRDGRYADALALARKAEAAAPNHTRVLQEAADIYLVAMRMLGLDAALLERCGSVMDRLRTRGTADPARLARMATFFERLRDGERAA